MSSLTDFLLARIDDDEAVAQTVATEHESEDWDAYMSSAGFYDTSAHRFAQRNDPARVLAECDAKRRIVEEHPLVQSQTQADVIGCDTCSWDDFSWGPEMVTNGPCVTLRALAIPYADHPDYDEDWRP